METSDQNASLGLYTDLLSAVMEYGLFCFDKGIQAVENSSEKAMNQRVQERVEKYQHIVNLLDEYTKTLTNKEEK